jgi:hypothetical protein
MRSARVALGFVGAVWALAPGISSGQGTSDPRLEMDGFAAALDAAVRRVSRPSPALLAGREGARGYRLPGFGVLFVLSPRALPSPSQRSIAEHEAARSLDDAIRHLEQGLRTAASPEVRAQMEKNRQALRQTRAELRGTARDRSATVVMLPPPGAVLAGEELMAAGPPPLEDLQRELETQMFEQMHALQEAEQSRGEQEREMARRMAEQVRELQARMEAVRRDVERARIEAERQVEMRLGVPPAATVTPVAPVAPAPPAAPLAPLAAEPDTVAETAAAPPMPGPPMLAPAPWQMWFTIEDPVDGRTGEAVIRDVKTAVTALLERQGAALHHLGPEEYVAVAVDFVPRPAMVGGRAPKTLLVKVRKRDLDERRAGRLAAEELRSRIEYAEY